jgi:hypothetical protein
MPDEAEDVLVVVQYVLPTSKGSNKVSRRIVSSTEQNTPNEKRKKKHMGERGP